MQKFFHKRGRRGFSLVELVIVIVIIGIIAAIAIPRVSRGSKGAGESSLSSNLAVLRNAIEMYASEHGGDYPGKNGDGTNAAGTAEAVINQLTKYSKATGEVSDVRDAANGYVFGPYLRKGIPPLPVGTNRGKSTLKIVTSGPPTADVPGGYGWVYSLATGEIIANSTEDNDAGDKTYDQY